MRGLYVRIQMISPVEDLRDILSNDGWTVEWDWEGELRVTHKDVLDEEQARERLSRLDLLTSANLRIEFQRCEA